MLLELIVDGSFITSNSLFWRLDHSSSMGISTVFVLVESEAKQAYLCSCLEGLHVSIDKYWLRVRDL